MEHVEIAQSPFAFLDVRLHPVAGRARPLQPLFALRKFRRDELTLRALHDIGEEARP